MADRGLLIVFSGPSGAGRKRLGREILRVLRINFNTCIDDDTCATSWCGLFLRTREEFEELIRQGQMLEYAEYVGNYYETPFDLHVNETLDKGTMSSLRLKSKEPFRLRKRFQMFLSF